MNVELRPATPADAQFLAVLFSEVHASEFAPLGLPPQALEQLLVMQFRAQTSGYAAQFPAAVDRIVMAAGEPVGRLLVNDGAGEIRLVDIALLGSHRGQGIGSQLIDAVKQQARAANLPLRLSVRPGNPARRLYERFGFGVSGGDGISVAMEIGPAPEPAEGVAEPDFPALACGEVKPGLTGNYFASLVGRTVSAQSQTGQQIDLLLASVRRLRVPSAGRATGLQTDPGDSFVALFRGPQEPVLPSANSRLQHGDDTPLDVFLVPVRRVPQGIEYEATFNRMRRL